MPARIAFPPESRPRADDSLRLDVRFTHIVYAKDGVVLVADDDSILLELPVAADVIRLIDGHRTAAGIAHALEGRHKPEIIHFVLLALGRRGIVREGPEGVTTATALHPPEPSAFTASLALRLREIWERRQGARFVRLPLEPRHGIDLILTDDYLEPHLGSIAARDTVLLSCVGAGRVWMGPLLAAGAAPCISCLRDRLQLNLAARTLIHLRDSADPQRLTVERIAQPIPAAAYQWLAHGVEYVLTSVHKGGAFSRIEVVHLDGRPKDSHPLVRLPQCARCGDPSLNVPAADIALRSRRKRPGSAGGFRMLEPAETLHRFRDHISPLTGVVRHVREVPVEGTDLIHVYTAKHALHHGAGSLRTLRSAHRDPSGGKGMTDLDARVGALCESLERFSGVYRGNEPLRRARRSELQADAVPPNEILLYADAQFAGREAWNAADAGGFQWVPEPYDDETIEWSEARSLQTGETRFVPAACVYLGFKGTGRRFARGDSNGLAGGNCLEEAVLQGFLELAERDAVALWWYNRARRPALSLESFAHTWVDRLRRYYTGLGRRLWALDLTTDLAIPCFAALSHVETSDRQDIIFGFGCHLDARIALVRALAELNQMLPTVLRSPEERRRQLMPEFLDAIRWWDSATIEEHPYLLPAEAPATEAGAYASPRSADLRDDVLHCVSRAHAVGCDVLVHDLTRPEIGFAVARVIAPGLRHFWRRLGSGRLYDTPVRLGWLDRPRAVEQMNPISMFV